MTNSLERTIKNQYAKFFNKKDWCIFKESSDYYIETAAKIKMKELVYGAEHLQLLRRNVTKRLFIGIGCELLLKAIYLKNGYCINKPKRQLGYSYPYKLENINKNDFKDDETLSLNQLIVKLFTIEKFGEDKSTIENGLIISKVFRNKEGHIVVHRHKYDPKNYRDIEKSLVCIYKKTFNEDLKLTFSFGEGEKALFTIKRTEEQIELNKKN